jgi:hypothetical protein
LVPEVSGKLLSGKLLRGLYMTPVFTVTDRNGQKALWVDEFNIWDLPNKELTPNVQKAIIHAYYVGTRYALARITEAMDKTRIDGEFNSKFIDKTGGKKC